MKLASGGMAEVYLARDGSEPRLDRVVALKLIHRDLVGQRGYREMFLNEARIAFQIVHPNVCRVFDFGESSGEYYFAMEYLVGEPMAQVMNRLAKEPEPRGSAFAACRLARVIADACAGLHAAHNAKCAHGSLLEVVHRDVTPRNLFLTYDGRAKLLDFGIATAQMKRYSTEKGGLVGNLPYMAPEQLTGGQIDRRVDVWALGVTLWEMLAMKRLFKRRTEMATVSAVLYDEIPPPSEVDLEIPEGFDHIVLKALEREPGRRWQSAREMELAIRQVLNAQPHVVRPADLSKWMAVIFPFGQRHRERLVRMARDGSSFASGRLHREK